MTLKRKNKIISLRLSDEEYQTFTQAARQEGVDSISEFTRVALSHMVSHHDLKDFKDLRDCKASLTTEVRLEEFADRLSVVEMRLEEMVAHSPHLPMGGLRRSRFKL